MRSSTVRRLFVVSVLSALAPATVARAQTWTGAASPDNNWTTIGNWDTAVPVSGNTANFNGAGTGNTAITLGGASQPIGSLYFDTASAAYTIGQQPGDALDFSAGGAITVNSTTAGQTINAAVLTHGGPGPLDGGLATTNNVANGVTTGDGLIGLTLGPVNIGGGTFFVRNGVANATTVLNGNITDTLGQPGTLSLAAITAGASNNSNFTINGNNTYTGGTSITVNTGSNGSIQIGSDTAFGTGKVTSTLQGNSAVYKAGGGARTIANVMDWNGGMNYVGSNSLSFTGPITVINSAAGGTRTFSNTMSTGASVIYGASPGSSTITLGNPVSNGGDGAGKTAIFSVGATATTTINDVLQDPAPGAGGGVTYQGSAGGVIQINSLNTYTGTTSLNGPATTQFNHDYAIGDPSGPFGTGNTLRFDNTNNNVMQPTGGDRTLAYPITLNFGYTFSNVTGETSNLTLTGPIAFLGTGRTMNNSMAGTLTLGSAATPSTITLPTSASQTVIMSGTGSTVINDKIQDSGAFSPATIIQISSTGSVNLNNLNTFTGSVNLTGAGTILPITVSSNALPGASFTAGPFGIGTVTTNSGTNQHFRPIGANRSISNALTLNFGVAMDNLPGDTWNVTFAGPISLTGTGRSITNGFSTGSAIGGSMIIGDPSAPSTITLATTASQNLNLASIWGPVVVNDVIKNATGVVGNVAVNNATGQAGVVVINSANIYTGTTTVARGTLLANNTSGSATGTGAVSVAFGSTIGGTGRITGALTNSGTIAPGTPGGAPGTFTAAGNVTDAASSAWNIELSGAAADKLVVGGALDLTASDSLNVTGTGSGTSWVIATYTGALTGTFDSVTSGYTVNYGSGANSQITLNAVAAGLPGDFNSDGKVDAGDYATWRKNDVANLSLANDGGATNQAARFTLWRANFGNPPGAGSGGGLTGGTVPEPGTILLASLALANLLLPRARKRAQF